MSICVSVERNGSLVQTGSDAQNCADYVLIDAQTFQDFSNMTPFWQVPSSGDLQEVFMVGFTLVLVCYLAAWGFGVVIHFMEKYHE